MENHQQEKNISYTNLWKELSNLFGWTRIDGGLNRFLIVLRRIKIIWYVLKKILISSAFGFWANSAHKFIHWTRFYCLRNYYTYSIYTISREESYNGLRRAWLKCQIVVPLVCFLLRSWNTINYPVPWISVLKIFASDD